MRVTQFEFRSICIALPFDINAILDDLFSKRRNIYIQSFPTNELYYSLMF